MSIGINKVYGVKRYVRRKLVLNDKVVDYLYMRLTSSKQYSANSYGSPVKEFVFISSNKEGYEPITKEKIKALLQHEENMREKLIVRLDDEPRDLKNPFAVRYHSPQNHRYEGDYDEDADEYHDVVSYTLEDFLYEDEDRVNPYVEPYFAKHQEQFDFEDEVIEEDIIRVANFEYR